MCSPRELDIVLFGATGVTGAFVVEELQRASEGLRWGVAGRNADKMLDTLRTVAANLGLEENALDEVPLIVADAEDEGSLLAMTQRTRLVLNTVGPYSFYGRQVVKACVRSGTHHIDISAEPQFMKQMEAEFHDEAREKGVLVLRACGFGSIPAEMCLSFLRQHFQGDLDRVESFLAIKEGPQGIKINFGTWQSIMHWLRNWSELMELMRHLPRRCILFRSEVAGGWCLPFPSSDRYVMNQSDMLRQDLFGVKPLVSPVSAVVPYKTDATSSLVMLQASRVIAQSDVQINTYMRAPGFFTGLGLLLLGTIFGLLSLFSAGRWLLERLLSYAFLSAECWVTYCLQFPGFFSAGKVKRGDLTREQVLSCSFTMTMYGCGWKQNHALKSEHEVGKSKHSVTIRLEGPDPAYVTTATCMLQVALVVLKELDRMPIKGGVLSPGVVLDSTSYVDRVEKRGIRMYVI